jgi:CRP-like cAMP-binding protein
MGSMSLDYFIHAANILLLAAYSVRDILWLRLFAVASSLAAIPYFLFQPTPLWAAFGWSVLFTGINIFQSWRLYRERRPVALTPEEEEVRRLAFPDLPPRKVLQVLSIGSWAASAPGERLIEHGKPVDSLSLIVRGNVRVSKEGHVLGDLGPGEIVGSALLLSGAVSDVDAVTVEPARTVRWEAATLERYLNANPETRNLLQRHLARDLAGKLQRLGTDFSKSASLHAPSARSLHVK